MRLLEAYRKKRLEHAGEGHTIMGQDAVMKKLERSIHVLTEHTYMLNYVAGNTNNGIRSVKSSIGEITEGNQELTDSISNVREASGVIDEGIGHNARYMEDLRSAAEEMTRDNTRIREIFDHLMTENQRTSEGISRVAENTRLSNEAAEEILQAAEMINNLTYKTNLLGLNASIEAARAGEVGKGFAIVAQEIQELAKRSKESADTIGRIMQKIREQALQSIKGIEDMQAAFSNQTRSLTETQSLMGATGQKIAQVYERVSQVESNMAELEISKDRILQHMDGLVRLAENNRQVTDLISADFREIEENSAQLTSIAFQLSEVNHELKYANREVLEEGIQQKEEMTHLRVGYMPNYGSLCSIAAAIKMGYLDQEYLSVELLEYENGGQIIDALKEGKLEIGYIGHGAHARCLKGEAVVFLLSHISNAEAVIGSRRSGARTPESLKGMRIGTVPGTTSDTILNYALSSAGIVREECQIISGTPAELVEDMISGRLDACALWSPWTLELEKQLGADAVILANNADFFHRLASLSSWISSPSYAEAHPEILKKFTAALYRGMNYRAVEENIRKVASWVSEITSIDAESAYEQRADAEWATAGFVSVGARNGKLKSLYEAQQAQFLKEGAIRSKVPVEQYVLFRNMIDAAR